ncbi:MAG: xanthine dehydrogenase family protein molybdopterin-binding subunit [Chloroflexota bacterium]
MSQYKIVGQEIRLTDGDKKVTGHQQFMGDIKLPGMLHARPVMSPYAHARIESIDVEAALAVEGVTAVLTADDLPKIPQRVRNRLFLARDRVIFAGQVVAMVLGETAVAAADGAEQVWVEYEPLPAAVTIDEAAAPDAPLVWPTGKPGETEEAAAHGTAMETSESDDDRPSNIPNQTTFTRGDIDAGFAAAATVVEHDFTTSFVHQSYLEPVSIVAQMEPWGGGATVWTGTQSPFYVRREVANVLGVEETAVRVITVTPGGAFGAKFLTYELLVALIAQKMQRPIRLALTRGEDLLATTPAPAMRFRAKVGLDQAGMLTAISADITVDNGCFPSSHGFAAFLLGSLYFSPNLLVNYRDVMTHKFSPGAYRAPGAPQAAFVINTLLDEAAEKLGLDPLLVKKQNAVRPGQPLITGDLCPLTGVEKVWAAAEAHPIWQNRAEAEAKGRGVGLAAGMWLGGIEPMSANARLQLDGSLHIVMGATDLTGQTTSFSQVAAETFGLDIDKVKVTQADTSAAGYAGGAGGSKIMYSMGPAIMKATKDALVQTLEIAAEEFEADPADLEIVEGQVQVRGVPDKRIGLGEIAGLTMRYGGKYAPVVGNGRHAVTERAPAFIIQIAEVEVDADTGEVVVHKLAVIQDVGQAINPLLLKGQMAGGTMQGLGWALYEGMGHDEGGSLITGSWMDYTVPHFTHAVPDLDLVIVQELSPNGPFGARGVAEPPIIPTAGAVANAIAAATGKRVTALPMTPPRVQAA